MRSCETLLGYRTFGEMGHSEDPYRTMIDAIPAMAWSSLPDGSVEFLNRRWLDYTGLSLHEALGWEWTTAVHPDDLDPLTDRWRALLAFRTGGRARSTPAPVRRRISVVLVPCRAHARQSRAHLQMVWRDPAATLQRMGGAKVILATPASTSSMERLIAGLAPRGRLIVVRSVARTDPGGPSSAYIRRALT